MAPVMTIGGLAVASLVVLLFALDLVAGFPFQRASLLVDAGFLFYGLVLGYLSWNAFRDQ